MNRSPLSRNNEEEGGSPSKFLIEGMHQAPSARFIFGFDTAPRDKERRCVSGAHRIYAVSRTSRVISRVTRFILQYPVNFFKAGTKRGARRLLAANPPLSDCAV